MLSLPGPLTSLSPSFSSGQDCENYITLLERQGERLLACGTNARRPSCWSLVRRALPYAWSAHPCPGGLLPPQGGGTQTLASPCVECLGDGGPGWKAATWALTCPVGLPQVNGTVESLGEKRGYAPFSPDENSLVLFDGRAVAGAGRPPGALPWAGGGCSAPCPVAQAREGTSRSCLP